MKTQATHDFSDAAALETRLNSTTTALLLVDRKVRVKQVNQAAGQMVAKSPEVLCGSSYGEGLGCIHIGDHPDGCGYGSICGDCFIHQAIKKSFKTKQPVQDVVGVLSIGSSNGVKRPRWKVGASPALYQGRLHTLISIVPFSERDEV